MKKVLIILLVLSTLVGCSSSSSSNTPPGKDYDVSKLSFEEFNELYGQMMTESLPEDRKNLALGKANGTWRYNIKIRNYTSGGGMFDEVGFAEMTVSNNADPRIQITLHPRLVIDGDNPREKTDEEAGYEPFGGDFDENRKLKLTGNECVLEIKRFYLWNGKEYLIATMWFSEEETGDFMMIRESSSAIDDNDPQDEFIGGKSNSPALDISPADGMKIKAPAGALYDDTQFTVTPVEKQNETIAALDKELQSNGAYLLAAYDINGGLEEGVHFPGEYEVSIDLEKAGIPESMYSWLHIGRLCDAGDIWEYPYEINGHTLTYKSSENSWIVIIGVPVIITGSIVLAKQSYDAKYGFFKGNSPVKTFTNPYGTYTVQWNMKYMDPDQQPTLDRMKEILDKWQKQAEEDFADEEKVKQASSGSFAWFFKRNTPVADRLKQYLEKDKEYIALSEKLLIPDNVREIIKMIDIAYKYLVDHEMIRAPKGTVEFLLKGVDPDNKNNLGGAQQSTFKKTYIDLYIKDPQLMLENTTEGIEARDNLLLTITHELFHICQERYHSAYLTDSNRFDEMTALVLESDAKEYYIEEGIITSNPKLTETNSRSMTMINPIDGDFWFITKNKHLFLQNQGYFLSTFVQFLRKETGDKVRPWRLMSGRSYIKKPNTSEPLMKAFNLTETQFDAYFRKFIKQNQDIIFADFGLASNEEWFTAAYTIEQTKLNKDAPIEFKFDPYGPYSVVYRAFLSPDKNPAAVLIEVETASDAHPEVELLGRTEFERTGFGYYMKAHWKQGAPLEMLELYGDLSLKKSDSGYKVWAAQAPDKPALAVRQGALYITLPQPVGPAKTDLIKGLIISVKNPDGTVKSFDAGKEYYGTEVAIPLSKVQPEDAESAYVLEVTLKEYTTSSNGTMLYMPESEPAKVKVGDENSEGQAYYGWVLAEDTLAGDFKKSEKEDTSDVHYWHDPWPTGSVVIIGDKEVRVELCGLDFTLHGQDLKYEKVKYEENFSRSPYTFTGRIVSRSEQWISAQLTEWPSDLTGKVSIETVEADIAGNDITYETIRLWETYRIWDIDTYYDSLSSGCSSISIRLENGEPVSVTVTISGTIGTSSTLDYAGKTETKNSERDSFVTFKLERE